MLAEAGLEPCAYERARVPVRRRPPRPRCALLGGRTARPPCTATTTCWPAASTSPPATSALRIPEDLSVVGFDDLPFAQVFDPPLTTIAIDPEALGATAFEVLSALMARRGARGPDPARVELVVRGSTAPAGALTAAGRVDVRVAARPT